METKKQKVVKAYVALRSDNYEIKRRVMVDNCLAVFTSKKVAQSVSNIVVPCKIIYQPL